MRLVSRSQPCARHCHFPLLVTMLASNNDTIADERAQTTAVADAALRDILVGDPVAVQWPAPDRRAPVLRATAHRRRYLFRSAVRYGDAPQQVLDVWRRKDLPVEPAPVLIFVPGGAWVHGSRILQGYTLMSHLAAQGWVCLSIDYRVAPRHRWPRHIQDVKAAIAWARANIDRFGRDRDFVALAGASAGGHLAALAGLTHDDGVFNAELPAGSDTSADAVVSIYGRYDWEDRSTTERGRFVAFLERVVVRQRWAQHGEVCRADHLGEPPGPHPDLRDRGYRLIWRRSDSSGASQ